MNYDKAINQGHEKGENSTNPRNILKLVSILGDIGQKNVEFKSQHFHLGSQ